MKKPNEEQVKTEIKRLRAFIEDESNDPLERRIAQIKEDTLRWCVEATDWESPSRDFGMAALIAREMKPTLRRKASQWRSSGSESDRPPSNACNVTSC